MGPVITPDPRTPSRRSRPTGQRGSILLLVLGVVMMLTVTVLAVMRMSTTTNVVSNRLETDTETLHLADGALEDATNSVRNGDNPCNGTEQYGNYAVACSQTIDAGPPQQRTVLLTASSGGNTVGRAQVRITAGVNGANLGQTLEVCDWLLGASLTEQMNGCG